MDILFQNKDWLVINKPTGISSQAAFAGDVAVPEWLKLYRGEDVHVFSRLDKGTSGVMILARHPAAAARAAQIQKSQTAIKEYVFLSASDSVKKGAGKSWKVTTPISGKSAETSFEKVGPCGRYFLYNTQIKGGRIHQIRRHAKESGVSVLGDDEYRGATFPRLCLHCKSVSWPDISENLKAPMPASMGSLGDFASDPGFLVAFDRRLHFYEGVTNVFRCVHRGEMNLIDCAIDFYAGWLCLWIYDEKTPLTKIEELLAPYLKKLFANYGAKGAVIKRNLKNPHARGLVQEQKILGETPPDFLDVVENGLKYRVSLTQGQHVGLFLDQRDNRLRVRHMAGKRRVANLFSYTSSFSIAAAAGGADMVVSVDSASPCLETGKLGFALNELDKNCQAKFIKDDVRSWLKYQIRKSESGDGKEKFDFVICDPPTFSMTKSGGNFSVEKEWRYLAEACRKITTTNADLLFCTNHRQGSKDDYRQILEEIFSRVMPVPAPLDFPALDEKQDSVKMFWCHS